MRSHKKNQSNFSGASNEMRQIVALQLKKTDAILAITKKHQTPLYLYDKLSLQNDLNNFYEIFRSNIPDFKPYYALKINHHEKILTESVRNGYGLDVASGWELVRALHTSCKDILFYSPGKTDEELTLAIIHNKRVRIHIDSFNELKRIGDITNKMKRSIRAGIRIHLHSVPQWIKFGIDISDLHTFWKTAGNYPYIQLEGIHFHASRNKNAEPYKESIKELGEYLRSNFSLSEISSIKYIDFGGGFEPYMSEGYYPYEFSRDASESSTSSYDDVKRRFSNQFKIREALPLITYAQQIGQAIRTYLSPLLNPQYYAEPGRIICDRAMHIVLTVVDVKNDDVCILDGGINMVGWQRYMYEYFPVINLTRPSLHSIPMTLYGKLCTTRDLWGYSCYAKKICIGDRILIPNQGALTYSIAQNWIMKIPKVYDL